MTDRLPSIQNTHIQNTHSNSCEQCQAQYARPEDRERAKRWVEFQVNRVRDDTV